jgi:hypothetical protein
VRANHDTTLDLSTGGDDWHEVYNDLLRVDSCQTRGLSRTLLQISDEWVLE